VRNVVPDTREGVLNVKSTKQVRLKAIGYGRCPDGRRLDHAWSHVAKEGDA
jgi:hypothetical protein